MARYSSAFGAMVDGGTDLQPLAFNRWSHHGVWERLLERAQQREGVKRGMAFLDGTTIRAHQKAAGAAKKGDLQRSAMSVKLLAARAVASPPRPAS
jgi:transposase